MGRSGTSTGRAPIARWCVPRASWPSLVAIVRDAGGGAMGGHQHAEGGMRKCRVRIRKSVPTPDNPKVSQDAWVERDAIFHRFGYRSAVGSESGVNIQVSAA